MASMRLQRIREMLSIKGRDHMVSRKIKILTTNYTFVLSISYIEIIIIQISICSLTFPTIWFKVKSNSKGRLIDYNGQALVNIPLSFLLVAIGEELIIRSYHSAIFIDNFLTWVLFNYPFLSFSFLLLFNYVTSLLLIFRFSIVLPHFLNFIW